MTINQGVMKLRKFFLVEKRLLMRTLIGNLARADDEKVGTDILASTSLEREDLLFWLAFHKCRDCNKHFFFSNNLRLNFFPFLESKFKWESKLEHTCSLTHKQREKKTLGFCWESSCFAPLILNYFLEWNVTKLHLYTL